MNCECYHLASEVFMKWETRNPDIIHQCFLCAYQIFQCLLINVMVNFTLVNFSDFENFVSIIQVFRNRTQLCSV